MHGIKYEDSTKVHAPADVLSVLNDALNDGNLRGNNKGIYSYNVPCAFDIETSSFYRDEDGTNYTYQQVAEIETKTGAKVNFEKINIMYVWQLGINGRIIIGRTWGEFVTCIRAIAEKLMLDEKRKIIIYAHNLSYEFQYIRTLFDWQNVFSIDLRKPIYAITTDFVEFRCSYLLSGYSLANLTRNILRYDIEKKSGDLDYELIRHSETELTPTELQYCIYDIKIVMLYILEQIENNKVITNIPITKTGFVRRFVRGRTLTTKQGKAKRKRNFKYLALMDELQINDLTEFDTLFRAFAGGFTHANAQYTDSEIKKVSSFDFNSSYPYVMVAEQFPMSRGVNVPVKSTKQFNDLLVKYCCVFDIEFLDLMPKLTHDNPMSVSKCFRKINITENNGRVVTADAVALTITNIDFDIFSRFYTWSNIRVGNMYCYKRGYLPTDFVSSILDLYGKKTTLKGVDGKELEYMQSKEMLNSCYGMSVTNPLRDEYVYDNIWFENQPSEDERGEMLFKHNNSQSRFLFYPWGVFVTVYARRNLFTGIEVAGDDYIYSDTDSLKLTNADRYKDYFDGFNAEVIDKLKTACKYHGLDYELCEPPTIKGDRKTLGVWDFEGVYTTFKTLGAKRYMIEQPNALKINGITYEHSLTVSGVNKFSAIPYLLDVYGCGIFDAFTNYLHLPPEATGKKIHTYIDYKTAGMVEDHTGKVGTFVEASAVHLEPTSYNLSLSVLYLKHLINIKLQK